MNTREKKSDRWYEVFFGPDYLVIDRHKDTAKEVSFIRSVLKLKKKTKLLDVACGYGRHLVPLVKRGYNVIGCDLSSFMLGEAHKNLGPMHSTRLVRCDVRNLPFVRAFDCACNMFNSFGYFEDEEDNFRVLTSIARALKPGGLFLLDHVNRDFIVQSLLKKDWFIHRNTVILEKKWIDSITNRSEVDVTVIDKSGKRDYHHSIRLYSFSELSMLLEAAGLIVLDVFGGFGGEDFDINRDRMLILSCVVNVEDE